MSKVTSLHCSLVSEVLKAFARVDDRFHRNTGYYERKKPFSQNPTG